MRLLMHSLWFLCLMVQFSRYSPDVLMIYSCCKEGLWLIHSISINLSFNEETYIKLYVIWEF